MLNLKASCFYPVVVYYINGCIFPQEKPIKIIVKFEILRMVRSCILGGIFIDKLCIVYFIYVGKLPQLQPAPLKIPIQVLLP